MTSLFQANSSLHKIVSNLTFGWLDQISIAESKSLNTFPIAIISTIETLETKLKLSPFAQKKEEEKGPKFNPSKQMVAPDYVLKCSLSIFLHVITWKVLLVSYSIWTIESHDKRKLQTIIRGLAKKNLNISPYYFLEVQISLHHHTILHWGTIIDLVYLSNSESRRSDIDHRIIIMSNLLSNEWRQY